MVNGVDFMEVTESPGNRVRQEAIDMLCTRYEFAANFTEGRDVLEVACGPGSGLGYLAARARRVVGGDYTASLVRLARQHYGSRLPVIQLDGQYLPFGDGSFDVVLLCEALYYLPDQARFVAEARRVLRPSGHLLIVSVNPRWPDFNPSPLSTKYLDADETRSLLERSGFHTSMNGAFRAVAPSARDRVVSIVKRAAVRLGFIPKTMSGKEMLKRLFFGELNAFPAELRPGTGAFHPPEPLPAGATSEPFKVLFAVGQLAGPRSPTVFEMSQAT